jgi:hypothetical protein
MRFEERDECGKERRFAGAAAELICPDSGQVEEPLRPTRIAKRCR